MFSYRMVREISYIARVAGEKILKIYNTRSKRLDLRIKFDYFPITNADLISNSIIVYLLKRLTPNIPVISEENVSEWRICKEWKNYWLVDPLDGTKDFLLGTGEFTVNIALIEYGHPVMGVVYAPVYNTLYAGDNGRAWKVYANGKCAYIAVKKVYSYPVITVSRYHFDINYQKKLCDYLSNYKNYKLIHVGSSLKFCLIAEGSAHLYPRFSSTKIWDTAAGHAVAVAAGALVCDWNGYPLYYGNFNRDFLNSGFQVFLH